MRRRKGVLLAVVGLLATSAPALAETAVERRLRLLEEQLQEAQDEIKHLRRQVEEQKTTGQVAKKQLQDEVAETKKTLAVPDWLKRTTIFGDVRLRHEGFYHQPASEGQLRTARNRERLRARIGVKTTFSDELSATIRLASGNPDDPISTNQTFGETFTPKNINLDWAYLTFTPGATFGIRPGLFSMNGGKFPNPIFRVSELVFDDDLSPEGASETLSFLAKPAGPLQQVRVHAFQWTFDEVQNEEDGWIFGGQVNPVFRFGSTEVEFGASHHWYLNENAIARARNDNDDLKVTNEVVEADDEIVAFANSFSVTNAAMAVTFPNVVGAMPLRFFGDFAHNWEADEDDNGYLGGLKLGQTKAQGDWAVSAFYEYLEREAAISVFTGSDFGLGGTNNSGPVLALDYQLLNPLTLTARNYFVNFIDRPAGMSNPTLFRLQLDALVRF